MTTYLTSREIAISFKHVITNSTSITDESDRSALIYLANSMIYDTAANKSKRLDLSGTRLFERFPPADVLNLVLDANKQDLIAAANEVGKVEYYPKLAIDAFAAMVKAVFAAADPQNGAPVQVKQVDCPVSLVDIWTFFESFRRKFPLTTYAAQWAAVFSHIQTFTSLNYRQFTENSSRKDRIESATLFVIITSLNSSRFADILHLWGLSLNYIAAISTIFNRQGVYYKDNDERKQVNYDIIRFALSLARQQETMSTFPFVGEAIRPLTKEGLSSAERNTLTRFISSDSSSLIRIFPDKCNSIPYERRVQLAPNVNVGQDLPSVDMFTVRMHVNASRERMRTMILDVFSHMPARVSTAKQLFDDMFSRRNIAKRSDELLAMFAKMFEPARARFGEFREYVREMSTTWFTEYDEDWRFRRLFEHIYAFAETADIGAEIGEKREEEEEFEDASMVGDRDDLIIAQLPGMTNVELAELSERYARGELSDRVEGAFRVELGNRRAADDNFDPFDYLPE